MAGDVNSVETYLKVITPDLPGPTINFGTWQSAIYGFAHAQVPTFFFVLQQGLKVLL